MRRGGPRPQKKKKKGTGSSKQAALVQIEGECDQCRRSGSLCVRTKPTHLRCEACTRSGRAVTCAWNHLTNQGTIKGESRS